MNDPDSALASSLSEFSARLLSEQELIPRARIIAREIAQILPQSAVNIYILAVSKGVEEWVPKGSHGEVSVNSRGIAARAGTLGELRSGKKPVTYSGTGLQREKYAHLDIRRTVVSLAYLPLVAGEALTGAIEILSFEKPLSREQLEALLPVANIAAAALGGAEKYEKERHEGLSSISRLTQLYDLEKVFSSTLEMDQLLPLIGSKFCEIMECEAINVWLMNPDESVQLMHQAGRDVTSMEGATQKPGEGIPGSVSDNGETVLICEKNDDRLRERNSGREVGTIESLLAVPILDRESLVGVIEAVNKKDGTPFDEDDLFALTSVTETASTALHNASLLLAERKVEILETLVTVSHEITSTLNLERMLQTIVNAPQAVIPYERAAIVLDQRGRFKLSAVSGVTQLNVDAPEIAPLNEILQWAALSEEIVYVRQHGEEIDSAREETRAKFRRYFEETGVRGFYAMPLNDDTGRVGLLGMESSNPDFLGPAHIEILEVLAGQATVALRNAQMYKEVPFISVLEPVLARKRKFMAMDKRRRALILALSLAALLFLVACPLPLRVDGDAVVAPVRRAFVEPQVEGAISKVFVHEGQVVQRGQVLAEIETWNLRSAVAEAKAKYESALLRMNHALSANDGTEAGIQRVQADYWKAECGRTQQLLALAEIRTPIDGVVATPHVETFVGRTLQQGDLFAEVVDTSQAVVDVAIDAVDAGMLRDGQGAVVKLDTYPARTFRGKVLIVSPKADLYNDDLVFYARVGIPNSEGLIRTGMEGRGKVRVGWYPAGYVYFRRPMLWVYSKLWSWLGW